MDSLMSGYAPRDNSLKKCIEEYGYYILVEYIKCELVSSGDHFVDHYHPYTRPVEKGRGYMFPKKNVKYDWQRGYRMFRANYPTETEVKSGHLYPHEYLSVIPKYVVIMRDKKEIMRIEISYNDLEKLRQYNKMEIVDDNIVWENEEE